MTKAQLIALLAERNERIAELESEVAELQEQIDFEFGRGSGKPSGLPPPDIADFPVTQFDPGFIAEIKFGKESTP